MAAAIGARRGGRPSQPVQLVEVASTAALAIRALSRMYRPQERLAEDRAKFGSPILQVEVLGQAAGLELGGVLLAPLS